MLRSLFAADERRLDPEDGQLRTLKELEELCKGQYTPEEVEIYWRTQCVPVGGSSTREHYSVHNDPFLTHTAGAEAEPRGPPAVAGPLGDVPMSEEQLVNVQANPFLTGGHYGSMAGAAGDAGAEHEVGNDPFLTHGARPQQPRIPIPTRPLPGAQEETFEDAARHWTESASRALGEGDLDRKPGARNILILMPWLLFVWMLVVWDLLRHYSNQAAAIITVVVFVGCFIQIVLWFSGKRWGPVSLLALGVLCLLACSLGIGIAEIGWDHWWRENWWLHTGVQSHADSASTPAASRSDAALLSFWNTRTQTTFNDTAVDYMRSAGYKDGHFYCVAPILDPDMAEASLVSVNYWAIGIDCCQNLGDFSCDASRQNGGAYGIVMLEHGFPSPGANADKFRGAVLKAETMHGLVSAPQAMFVRYVHTPSDVTTPLMVQSVLFLVISVLVGLLVFSILGFIAWYYGVGKRDSFDSLAYFLPRQPKQLV